MAARRAFLHWHGSFYTTVRLSAIRFVGRSAAGKGLAVPAAPQPGRHRPIPSSIESSIDKSTARRGRPADGGSTVLLETHQLFDQ